ncbi:MAG: methylmalonyl-CoA mutase family protein [Bacteroidota bacterium]
MKKAAEILSGFKAPEFSEWEKAIAKELKGADYKTVLGWNTDNGFSMLPFYNSKNSSAKKIYHSFKNSNHWEINRMIKVNDIASANKQALKALNEGVSSLTFRNEKKKISYDEFSALLKGIQIAYIEVNFENFSTEGIKHLVRYADENGINKNELRAGFLNDPYGELIVKGSFPVSRAGSEKEIIEQAKAAKNISPQPRVVSVNATSFHHAGATTMQEIAFALAQGHEYLYLLCNNGIPADDASAVIGFRFSAGNEFYAEIAKLRAFRKLWAMVVEQYHPQHECSKNTYIQSETSLFYFSVKDANTNMLRSTSQAIAAIAAGCDSLYIHPYNGKYDDEFSQRIASNIQLMLKEEAEMDKVADPAAGSYFIEELTRKLAAGAWKLFKETESAGGFISSLEKNLLQPAIEKASKEKKDAFKNGKIVLTGVNKFPNPADQPEQASSPSFISSPLSSPVNTVRLFRLAEETEKTGIKSHAS